MAVLYERNHETEFLILGQNPPAVPDTVTVTVSGTHPSPTGISYLGTMLARAWVDSILTL